MADESSTTEVVTMLDTYAEILVRHAVGLRPGQDIYIRGHEEQREFGLRVGDAAYAHGARSVRYRFPRLDEIRQLLCNGSLEQISLYQEDLRDFYTDVLKRRAALINLTHHQVPSPWFSELEHMYPQKYAFFVRGMEEINMKLYDYLRWRMFPHTMVPGAIPRWAQKMFPESADPLHELWDILFRWACADKDNFGEILEEKARVQRERLHYLDSLGIRKIRITGNDNDLIIGISDHVRWIGSVYETKSGESYYPNFPSCEIYTTPDCRETEGILVISMPFRLYDFSMVSDLILEFREGEIVDFRAATGGEAFAKWLRTDPGARHLGEIGLVGDPSPLQQAGVFFDHPMLDENVASHIALGKGIRAAFRDTDVLSDTQLESYGCNDALVHTDMVFGVPSVSIVATETNQGEVPLIEAGRWVNAV